MAATPTSTLGYLDDALNYGSLLVDLGDTIPDCLWPASNETYRQMRHHHQLAAVEKAFTLPIRRATWTLSPAGCDPKVVKRNADDLGLPVAGDDQPGAARVRGVSWSDHLRLAMLSLPYGHSGFELRAEIRDGQARLVELSERLPTTISEIHTDLVGHLTGVTQHMYDGKRVPQIGAERLAWYVREREGAAWWGRSLLRPAYPAWLLSREMLRVIATGHRRFSVGVPTGEWDPGYNPTPEQNVRLQQAMSAARVGETGGLAMPPGAHMKLIGLTGSVPDTLAFVRYLDQAMARQALASFLDLGTTDTGSRALAGEFIDLFLLAIQAEADSIADTCSRQVSARLVEWNEGLDEPVPAVQVGDVGVSHETTAEALQMLLSSGALTNDPGLEAYIRRQFNLPERQDVPQPAPSVAGDTVTAANRKPRRKRAPAAGQLTLPIASTVTPDHAQIQQDWETAKTDMLDQWPDLVAPVAAAIVAMAVSAVAAGSIATLGALTVDAILVHTLASGLADRMAALAEAAAGQATGEAAALGLIADGVIDRARLDGIAAAMAGQIANSYAQAAGRKALVLAGSIDLDAALTTLLDDMSASTNGVVAETVAAAMSAAQNAGRAAILAELADVEWVGDESNDANTCAPCRAANGTVYTSWSDAEAAYPVVGFHDCVGGGRCRGMLRPRLKI